MTTTLVLQAVVVMPAFLNAKIHEFGCGVSEFLGHSFQNRRPRFQR